MEWTIRNFWSKRQKGVTTSIVPNRGMLVTPLFPTAPPFGKSIHSEKTKTCKAYKPYYQDVIGSHSRFVAEESIAGGHLNVIMAVSQIYWNKASIEKQGEVRYTNFSKIPLSSFDATHIKRGVKNGYYL